MKTTRQTPRVKQQIIRLGAASMTSPDFRSKLLSLLRETVPFDAACCTHVDPNTLLSTGAVTEENIEAIHPHLFRIEYGKGDYNAYEQLVHAETPVATLFEATEGQPERSARYREVLRPAGFHDELRAALVHDRACWGYLTLYRNTGQPVFSPDERKFIAILAPVIAACLRTYSVALPESGSVGSEGGNEPGIAILSGQLALLSTNPAADAWIRKLQSWERIDSGTLPRPIRAVSTRALHAASQSPALAKACIRMPDGPYLTVRASRLQAVNGDIQLAVTFEPARPSDMLPIIAEAYQFTERELQLLEGLIRGLSTKELAATLHISAYTVQDHLKSIFAKTGVASRRELIWHLHSRFSLPNV
ncbi:LuxR C-terminal-related transcriptional regulator [Paenibacillus sp. DMB20]|uniref:LuxR C-terminal-related transcriptional regulator n=1 Tax=Paenibacillus sp. DMB20 TaxID=1642570 RepID=UPI0006275128|nr:LuxR C-terminal-related transcriptional regulator [Paenibacillus sp. DMB20]KKO53877.1 DNA-binding protein [Paenibacillus sp. DMB20]